MMGQHHEQNQLFNYSVNLERRVRRDHPLRAVRQALGDLAWVRPAVAHTYGGNGPVSADPVLLVKMMVLLFLDDVPSERELMDVIAERLDYLWFLGLGLDDDIPHHSVLSKARARWGSALFEDLFVRSICLCVQAGLVEGGKLHLDSSLTRPIFTELVRLGQSQAESAAAKKDLGRRRHLMEGSFADAANNHGFKQARWRGLMRQKIQNWIIAAVQNIRIWMGKRGPGTRTAAQNRVLFRFCNLKRPHWFQIGEFLGLTRFSPRFSTNLGWTRVRSFGQHARKESQISSKIRH
jgi:transposase